MTKQIELPSGRYLLVQVGKDWFDFEIVHSTLEGCDVLEYKNPVIWNKYRKGNCNWNTAVGSRLMLVGKADQLTEDQWKGIVGHVAGSFEIPSWKGLSIVKGHGFEIDTTLILKID